MTPPSASSTLIPLLIEAARAFISQENWVSAEESATEAVRMSRASNVPEREADALFLLGRALSGGGDRDAAIATLSECRLLQESRLDLLAAAHTACQIGITHRVSGNLAAARVALLDSLRLSASTSPGTERADALEQLGIVERRMGELEAASEHLSEALRIYEALGDRKRAADAREKLGNICQNLGRLEEAMRHYETCLEVFTELRDLARVATTHNNIAGALHQQGASNRAIEHSEQARSLFTQLSMPRQLAVTVGNLGLLQMLLGQADAAEDLLRQSLTLGDQLGDRLLQASALSNLAQLHNVSGNYAIAIEWADRAIDLKLELGQKEGLSKTFLVKANSLLSLGRLTDADDVRRFARENLGLDPSVEVAAELCRIDCEYYLGLGDLEAADAAARNALELTREASPYHAAEAQRLLGTIERRRGRREAAREYLSAAESEFRRIGDPYRLGLTAIELGHLFLQAEAHEAAAGRLREARQAFHGLRNHAFEWKSLLRLIEAEFGLSEAQAESSLEEARVLAAARGGPEQLTELESLWRRLVDRPTVVLSSMTAHLRGLERAINELRRGETLECQSVASFLLEQDGMLGLSIDLEGRASTEEIHDLGRRVARTNPTVLAQAVATARTGGESVRVATETSGVVGLAIPVLCIPRGVICAVVRASRETALGILLETTAILLAEWMRPSSGSAAFLSSAVARTTLSTSRAEAPQFHGMVGQAPLLQSLCRTIVQVAPTTASVLLEGESGTGKELVARAIHEQSGRKGAFIAINCPSFPENLIEAELFGYEKGAFTGATQRRPGQVELADGGTLFLDEIGDMSMATQTKLLRFLEEREFLRVGGREPVHVDVRLLAATSRDLEAELLAGRFRKDLYHRIKVIPLRMPPLRERKEDIPILLEHFLEEFAPGRRFAPEVSDELMSYAWPGNIRELRNLVHRITATSSGPWIGLDAVPAEYRTAANSSPSGRRESGPLELRPGETLGARLMTIEGALLRAALEQCDWNQSQASRRLGLTESTLREKMVRFGIRRPEETRKAGRRPGSAAPASDRRTRTNRDRRKHDARSDEIAPS